MKKRVLAMLMAMAMIGAMLAGCSDGKEEKAEENQAEPSQTESSQEEPGQAEEEGKMTFAYLPTGLSNPFFVAVADTFKEECKERGDELIVLDPGSDQAKQISQMEDVITQGVDMIFLTAVDAESVRPALESAKEKGVDVIAIDTYLNEEDRDLVLTTVIADNYNAGLLSGEQMVKDFPDGAKIAILDFPVHISCVDRVNGFFDGLGDKKDKFDVVAEQNGNAALEESMTLAESILQANPDVEAFFCINDPSALGAIAAIEAAGKSGQIKVYSVDGSPDGKAAIQDGALRCTVAQSPISLAKDSLKTADKFFAGEDVSESVLVETFPITADNLDEYGVDGWQ